MFVDYVKVTAIAGDGGSGCMAFRREKHVPRGGPNGGDGGKGGDVIFEADPQLATLLDIKMRPLIRASRGANGQGWNKSGKDGEDVVVKLPLGSVVLENGEPVADLTEPGQRVVIAKGGMGGLGNQHFATPTNRAPRHFQPGMPGEARSLEIELKQIADIGLVGLPNAGKSTLLSRLTAAMPKIAPYPFTTLSPNLGVFDDEQGRHVTLADLPGLIEGASRGEGLGHRFLRHVERTKLLLQLIAFDGAAPDFAAMRAEWDLIGEELRAYSEELAAKPRHLALSKSDLCRAEQREAILREFEKNGIIPLCVSSENGEGIEELRRSLIDWLRPYRDIESPAAPEEAAANQAETELS